MTGLQQSSEARAGGTTKPGRELKSGLIADRAVALARKVIVFYRENGKAPERLGATIERVGFDTFAKAVL